MPTPLVLAAPLALLAAAALPQPAHAGPLRAGAAKVSITPAPDEFPYVYEKERSCEPEFAPGKPCNFVGVHDPIYARALIVGDGAHLVAIVLVEAVAVPDADALRSAIAKEAGIAEANVLLAATHTHEVPLVKYRGGAPNPAEAREIARVKAGAIAAMRQAKASMRHARIAFARGMGWVNVNNGDSIGTAGYNPAGPTDRSLDVIRLVGDDGKPIALMLNYASHAEVMYRSVTRDGGYEVTGDIPGTVSSTLEALPTGAPVVLFSAAAEGDQMSLFKSLQAADGALPAHDEGAAGWALLDVTGRRLTASVLDIVKAMPAGTDQAPIGAAAGAATCPGQHKREDAATGKVVTEPTGPVRIPLAVVRIGDIALAGVGGDLGSEIGMAIKKTSPVAHTTIVTMTAGSVGYVLADSSYVRDSHGIMASPLQPHCAPDAIPHGIDGLMRSLSPGQ